MVHRHALRKIITNSKLVAFIRRQPRWYSSPHSRSPSQCQPKSNRDRVIWPLNPFLERPISMFHPEKIMKYYEVVPIIFMAGASFIFNSCLFNLRNALTRDDVRYFKGAKMNCEIVEMDRKKKPKIRKFIVINQKYETPEGLIKALEEPKSDPKAKK